MALHGLMIDHLLCDVSHQSKWRLPEDIFVVVFNEVGNTFLTSNLILYFLIEVEK